jgi:CheY-like chemotaxis protein
MRASRYVLILGSDAGHLVYTSILVQRFEYHVCSAAGADEALEMARAMVPALVITDLLPKGMTALQFIAELRRDEATANVPVIIKLEASSPRAVQECLDAGAAACVRKPVVPEELFAAIQSAIEPFPRKHIRIRTGLSVILNNQPRERIAQDRVTMLSARGMYVRTRQRYALNTTIPVEIDLDGRAIRAQARVIYSHGDGEGPFGEAGMGLFFTLIDQFDQTVLQHYINNQVTKGISPAGAR